MTDGPAGTIGHGSSRLLTLKILITENPPKTFQNAEDTLIYLQMLMKCSDVSNPTKPWDIYEEWIKRIMEEFHAQGDREKALGLPISPFCNRESPNIPLCQKSFINFI